MKISKSKQYMNVYMKLYIRESEPVECLCGSVYKSVYRYKHIRTARHLQFLEFNKAFKSLKDI